MFKLVTRGLAAFLFAAVIFQSAHAQACNLNDTRVTSLGEPEICAARGSRTVWATDWKKMTGLFVTVDQDGQVLTPGNKYIVPKDHPITVADGQIEGQEIEIVSPSDINDGQGPIVSGKFRNPITGLIATQTTWRANTGYRLIWDGAAWFGHDIVNSVPLSTTLHNGTPLRGGTSYEIGGFDVNAAFTLPESPVNQIDIAITPSSTEGFFIEQFDQSAGAPQVIQTPDGNINRRYFIPADGSGEVYRIIGNASSINPRWTVYKIGGTEGIPEWDTSKTYARQDFVVQDFVLYVSLINGNVGNSPKDDDGTQWQQYPATLPALNPDDIAVWDADETGILAGSLRKTIDGADVTIWSRRVNDPSADNVAAPEADKWADLTEQISSGSQITLVNSGAVNGNYNALYGAGSVPRYYGVIATGNVNFIYPPGTGANESQVSIVYNRSQTAIVTLYGKDVPFGSMAFVIADGFTEPNVIVSGGGPTVVNSDVLYMRTGSANNSGGPHHHGSFVAPNTGFIEFTYWEVANNNHIYANLGTTVGGTDVFNGTTYRIDDGSANGHSVTRRLSVVSGRRYYVSGHGGGGTTGTIGVLVRWLAATDVGDN